MLRGVPTATMSRHPPAGDARQRRSRRIGDTIEPVSAVLPTFRYHADPIASRSVLKEAVTCQCCGQAREHRYDGPIYSKARVTDLCPWCIADGSAAAHFDAQFTTTDLIGREPIPREFVDEVLRRTPGFSGWQQDQWMFHCGDAAAYLGRVGYEQLVGHDDAIEMLSAPMREIGWTDAQITAYVGWLHVDGDATAYLFRCLHCSTELAYADES